MSWPQPGIGKNSRSLAGVRLGPRLIPTFFSLRLGDFARPFGTTFQAYSPRLSPKSTLNARASRSNELPICRAKAPRRKDTTSLADLWLSSNHLATVGTMKRFDASKRGRRGCLSSWLPFCHVENVRRFSIGSPTCRQPKPHRKSWPKTPHKLGQWLGTICCHTALQLTHRRLNHRQVVATNSFPLTLARDRKLRLPPLPVASTRHRASFQVV